MATYNINLVRLREGATIERMARYLMRLDECPPLARAISSRLAANHVQKFGRSNRRISAIGEIWIALVNEKADQIKSMLISNLANDPLIRHAARFHALAMLLRIEDRITNAKHCRPNQLIGPTYVAATILELATLRRQR
jgi:hypothetical protein